MARKLRFQFEGAIYHVYARGNEQQVIFRCDDDRHVFLYLLKETIKRYNWKCFAYCLMNNHYHLLIQTMSATLSQGMHWLSCVYTQKFNFRHDRVGHLFQGRFKDTLVQNGDHMDIVHRYIVLNPVRAAIVDKPEDWPWSSYSAVVGRNESSDWLDNHGALVGFGGVNCAGRRNYSNYIKQADGHDAPNIYVPIFGDDEFISSQQELASESVDEVEYPMVQRKLSRPCLLDIIPDKTKWSRNDIPKRNAAIIAAIYNHRYSQKEIANHLGLHYTLISKIVKAEKSKIQDVTPAT
jgi:REP element-mobilizing transposase RayT